MGQTRAVKAVSLFQIFQGSVEQDQPVLVRGWVRTRRDSKAGVSFIQLSDGSCQKTLQLVVPSALANYVSEVQKLSAGCSLKATGRLVTSPGGKQAVELAVEQLEVLGWVDAPEEYPIQPKRHSLEFLREVAHLRPRTNTFGALARVRDALSARIHQFFRGERFFWVHTPIITASDCEGAGAMFRVSTLDLNNLPRDPNGQLDFKQDFFGKEAFLTVSGQLELETYCCALSRVYTFGPTFRAENSNTSRHLSEFWMVEPEMAFADLAADAQLAERFLRSIVQGVLEECPDELDFFREHVDPQCLTRLETFLSSSFEQLTYTEAIGHLEKAIANGHRFEFSVKWGIDLQSEHERYLTEQLCGRPVVVTHYPKEIKAFYMRLDDDGRTVSAMDILAPGVGEIIGGAQREERLDVLDARLRELSMDPAHYGWYRDLRRYGTVPHAGFGLGLERMLCYLTGLTNVRDVIPFPRSPKNAEF